MGYGEVHNLRKEGCLNVDWYEEEVDDYSGEIYEVHHKGFVAKVARSVGLKVQYSGVVSKAQIGPVEWVEYCGEMGVGVFGRMGQEEVCELCRGQGDGLKVHG